MTITDRNDAVAALSSRTETPATAVVDPGDSTFQTFALANQQLPPQERVGSLVAAPRVAQLAAPFHAYANSRKDVDWNTCGQAAIGTILDFHHRNPFNLPRVKGWVDGKLYWDDGAIIDAVKNAGYAADVVFGWGTTGGRIRDALRHYGLSAEVGYSGLFSAGWQDQWKTLQSYLNASLPVPVLLDLGAIGGPSYGAHWAIAYRYDANSVSLANCPWNPAPSVDAFLGAWHTWFLPYGFNHCGVYAH